MNAPVGTSLSTCAARSNFSILCTCLSPSLNALPPTHPHQVNFILQEAHEKANEIMVKTEHDFK